MKESLIKITYGLSIISLLTVLGGCSIFGFGVDPELTIKIKTNQYTNNGNNFYMIATQDDDKDYIGNTYYSLYSQFNNIQYKRYFITPKYESNYSFSYPIDLKKSTSLYFLFNDNSRQWKIRIKPKTKKVILEVKNNKVIMGK